MLIGDTVNNFQSNNTVKQKWNQTAQWKNFFGRLHSDNFFQLQTQTLFISLCSKRSEVNLGYIITCGFLKVFIIAEQHYKSFCIDNSVLEKKISFTTIGDQVDLSKIVVWWSCHTIHGACCLSQTWVLQFVTSFS